MDIRVIITVLGSATELVDKNCKEYQAAARKGVKLSFVALSNGTETIESERDLALAQPDTIRLVQEAEADGVDACIITCFGDPGAPAAKETVSIPVVGAGEAALHFAHMLGYRYSIITVQSETVPLMRNMATRAGLADRLASVRPVNFGVMDLSLNCVPQIVDESIRAIMDDGADVIVMGCTGTGLGMADLVQQRIRDRLGVYVPVIDPVKSAMKFAEALVDAGVTHSKVAYPTPRTARSEYLYQIKTGPVVSSTNKSSAIT
jgi:allantoin racemase